MNKVIVDANVFLRFFLKDVKAQYEIARKLFLDAGDGKVELIVPQIVIFEINFALDKYYHIQKPQILENIQSLLAVKYFKIQNKEVFKRALLIYRKRNLSLTDIFLMVRSQNINAQLFTFDKGLKKLAEKHSQDV